MALDLDTTLTLLKSHGVRAARFYDNGSIRSVEFGQSEVPAELRPEDVDVPNPYIEAAQILSKSRMARTEVE